MSNLPVIAFAVLFFAGAGITWGYLLQRGCQLPGMLMPGIRIMMYFTMLPGVLALLAASVINGTIWGTAGFVVAWIAEPTLEAVR